MREVIKVVTGKGAVKFPHDDADLCPTYFDGCHCMETSIENMSKIANDAQLECGELEQDRDKYKSAFEGMTADYIKELNDMKAVLSTFGNITFERTIQSINEKICKIKAEAERVKGELGK